MARQSCSFGAKLLGNATRAASYLGRNLGNISSGVKSVQAFVQNPDVQRIGKEVGISPSVFRTAGQVASTVGNAINLVPQLGSDLRSAGAVAMGSISGSTKRSLADLYDQANNIGQ